MAVYRFGPYELDGFATVSRPGFTTRTRNVIVTGQNVALPFTVARAAVQDSVDASSTACNRVEAIGAPRSFHSCVHFGS